MSSLYPLNVSHSVTFSKLHSSLLGVYVVDQFKVMHTLEVKEKRTQFLQLLTDDILKKCVFTAAGCSVGMSLL